MNQEKLLKLKGDHHAVQGGRALYCYKGCGLWPDDCEVAQLVDLALEAERLKKDGGSLAQRELKDHYEQRAHKAEAEAERLRAALAAALEAMEYMGDQLNGLDAASEEGVAKVSPAFALARSALAGTEAKR